VQGGSDTPVSGLAAARRVEEIRAAQAGLLSDMDQVAAAVYRPFG
jgi:hypothetical protein